MQNFPQGTSNIIMIWNASSAVGLSWEIASWYAKPVTVRLRVSVLPSLLRVTGSEPRISAHKRSGLHSPLIGMVRSRKE